MNEKYKNYKFSIYKIKQNEQIIKNRFSIHSRSREQGTGGGGSDNEARTGSARLF